LESSLRRLEGYIFELGSENSDSLSVDKIGQYIQLVKKQKEPAYNGDERKNNNKKAFTMRKSRTIQILK
jgi:hypothetical protein